MEQRGFKVRMADTVTEATELIRQEPPAFAVVDMRLEDGNGLEVIAELSKLRPNARAIVLTGYGNIAMPTLCGYQQRQDRYSFYQ